MRYYVEVHWPGREARYDPYHPVMTDGQGLAKERQTRCEALSDWSAQEIVRHSLAMGAISATIVAIDDN